MEQWIGMAAIFLGAVFAASLCPANDDLAAHYSFDEGAGAVLKDHSGNGNDGDIHGPQWVKCGKGFALKFDGKDDFVEFPASKSLDITEAITVEVWVKPEGLPGYGEPGVAGKGYESYVITFYQDGKCWWYISGGPHNCKATVSLGAWHHVVGTFDGKVMKLYVDGDLMEERPSPVSQIPSGEEAFLGKSSGEVQYTQNAHFKGQIGPMRIRRRALSQEEVMKEFRTTHLTGEVETASRAYPFGKEIAVYLNVRGLGDLPQGASLTVELFQPGRSRALKSHRLPSVKSGETAEASLTIGDLRPGNYEVRTVARDAKGRQIGNTSVESISWPQQASWPSAPPGTKVLNNLVTELLRVKPKASPSEVVFTNPRKGWVYIGAEATIRGKGELRLSLATVPGNEDISVFGEGKDLFQEAMRCLPAGKHTLLFRRNGEANLQSLTVRAVPELIYCQFPQTPHIAPHGPYDWEFLTEDVLRNSNCIIAHHSDDYRPYAEAWKKRGGKWIISSPVPGLDGSTVTAERAFDFWASSPGFQNPLYDGVIADEFSGGNGPQYDGWTEGLRRIFQDSKLTGKTFYPWCGPMFAAEKSRQFIQLVMDNGSQIAFERYLQEQPTETLARRHLESSLSTIAGDWEKAQPGAIAHIIMTLGYMSAPFETLNVNPAVDYKVYMDTQFNLLANDPTFFGLYGIMEYLSSYADEETVRWAGRLYRHYGIEGKSNLLSQEYGFEYQLHHLQNPDFAEGLKGWNVEPAEKDSVTTKSLQGFSWLEGRYPPTNQGNAFLWMKRSASKPNRVSQVVKNLRPGNLYSLKLIVADFGDLSQGKSVKAQHAVSVALDGVEIDEKKRFAHVIENCYSHHLPPFDNKHKAWMNYHFCVFRAKGKEAKLVISDWASEHEPGAQLGQELMLNFVELQPYLE